MMSKGKVFIKVRAFNCGDFINIIIRYKDEILSVFQDYGEIKKIGKTSLPINLGFLPTDCVQNITDILTLQLLNNGYEVEYIREEFDPCFSNPLSVRRGIVKDFKRWFVEKII